MGPKVIFIYSRATGTEKSFRHVEAIKESLSLIYDDLTCRETTSSEDFIASCRECGAYDEVILYGGDGSFNVLCHELVLMDKPPLIGYINGGTLNDCGKPFGIRGSYKNALKIIKRRNTATFDVWKIGDSHFTYMAACGAYSDISYVAPRKDKKKIGKLKYYLIATKEAFKKTRIVVEVNGKKYVTPFLLIMNGDHVGGFKVNKGSINNDGKLEVYIVKPGVFNGLGEYAFRRKKILKLEGDNFSIHYDGQWCVDGEKGPVGNVDISLEKKRLHIFTK